MTILIGLETKQIDYTSAFVQADIDTDLYLEMPRGFSIEGKIWFINRSIYGFKKSPRNYYLHMKDKLRKLDCYPTDTDTCLFISADIICLRYVDDSIFVYRNQAHMNDLVERIGKLGMLFNEENDMAGFLGVHIDR